MDQEKSSTATSTDSTTTTISAAGESSPRPTKVPSSRFKGVVPQPNGRWGAQIYEKHQRVWLGTFALEHEAARAYDVAAKRFRGRVAAVNFTTEDALVDDDHEEGFLSRHSKMEIVDMLRKHTYDEELEQSRRRKSFLMSDSVESPADADKATAIKEVLFEKVVTPSDVGKLNRLVIPKQHAENHFPLKSDDASTKNYGSYLLNFEDVIGGKAWRFRYSYWNSSQSYVLTRGWSRFVKEKNLKAGDVVSFLRSCGGGGGGGGEAQLYIDCNRSNRDEVEKVIRLFGVDVRVGEKRRCFGGMEVLGDFDDDDDKKKPRIV